MEPLPQKIRKRKAELRRESTPPLAQCLLLPLALALAGCASTSQVTAQDDKPPTGVVCQVITTWNHEVVVTPDPAHNGAPTPGIAGRVYLFAQEVGIPLIGDGTLTVDLYDDSPKVTGKPPVLIEEWRIDKDTLHRLARKDVVGWGYTVFLPWGTYKPETTQVHLTACYKPAKGTPLYASASPLNLDHGACTTLLASAKPPPRSLPAEPSPSVVQTAARQVTITPPAGH